MIRYIDFNYSMPMHLYQSCHTVNISLKLPYYKIALKSNIVWHVKAEREKIARSKAGKSTDVHHTKIIAHGQM